jgi:hypothetical protein
LAIAATLWLDAVISCMEPATSVTDELRLVVFVATCSIETPSSFTDETSSSPDAVTDSACLAVCVSDEAIWVTPVAASTIAAELPFGAVAEFRDDRRDARCRAR